MAGATRRIGLAVQVLNASLRHPFLLASQLATAQAASAGRVEVGLGAGSFHLARFDHRAIGVAFPAHRHRIARLEACCESFPRLWRGETVDDPRLGLSGASLGPIGIDPPRLVVGGTGDRAMQVAAKHADAWNANTDDPSAFTQLCERLAVVCQRVGRDRPIERQAQVFARQLELSTARHVVAAFADAGADALMIVLDEERGADEVRRLADAVL